METPRRRKLRIPVETPTEARRAYALAQLQTLDTRRQIQQQREQRAIRLVQRTVATTRVQRLVRTFVSRRPNIIRVTIANANAPEILISEIFQAYRTRPFTIQIRMDGNVLAEGRFNFTNIQSSDRARDYLREFFIQYDADEFKFDVNSRIYIYPYERVQPNAIRQAYREGEQHCFFTPLIALWSAPAKTPSTQKEQDTILKRVKKLAEEYGNNPVPHEDIPLIAKKCNTTIKIYDPLGNELFNFNPSSRKTLCLRHTRNNHVEPTSNTREPREITYDEAQSIIENTNEGEIVVEGSFFDPTKIYTNTEILTIHNPMKPYLDEIRNNIPDIKFNATDHPDVNNYLLQSRIINSATLTFNPDFDQHYDLEKAYTQFHTTSFYEGFLGKIHQWRSFTFPPDNKFLTDHVGIYKAIINKPSKLAKMLGMHAGDHLILPSPEWKFHKANGTDFTIISGVFGHTFDFRFPASSLQTVKTRLGTSQTKAFNTATTENKPFRIFAGQCSSKVNEFHKRTYTFRATESFAGHLASIYPDTEYNKELNRVSVNIPLDKVYTQHHLLSFITSYTRIIMMEQMLKLQLNNLSAVTLDGLYFKGKPSSPFTSCFRPKTPKHNPIGNNPWYVPVNSSEKFPLITPYNQNSALLGAGGTGKTHKILTDPGFNDILYVSPTHELGKSKQQEFNIPYTTLHRAIGENCRSYRDTNGVPAVIFVDEITQMEDEFIERLIRLYPESLIFVAGDIDDTGRHFQCKYANTIWKPTFKCFTFTTDYRSHTQELKKIKIDLRSIMQTNPTADDMKNYAHKHFRHIPWADAVLDFKPEQDIWIAGTHKYINKHPFKIHTTHSYQGKTIELPKRLFISTDDLFEHTMLYTAISRARSHDQLVFVSGKPIPTEAIQTYLNSPDTQNDKTVLALANLYNLTKFHKSQGDNVINDKAAETCGRCKKWGSGFLYTNGREEYHICETCIPTE